MRTEEHFGQFGWRKIVKSREEIPGRVFCKKYLETFFGIGAKRFWLVFSNRYLRVRIINLGRIGALKISKQLLTNQKLASYLVLRRFPSTPECANGQYIIQEGTKANDFLLFWFLWLPVSEEIMSGSTAAVQPYCRYWFAHLGWVRTK